MTPSLVALGAAYAVTTALLLNLNLALPRAGWLKFAAVVLVSLLYLVTWQGINGLLGWSSRSPMPDQFRLHWVTVDEPDKKRATAGAIYFWIRGLDDAGLPTGEPRAHRVRWDEATAEAAERALTDLRDGKPLNGRMSRQIVNPDQRPEEDAPRYQTDGGGGPGEQPRFEFVRVPPPSLPPKGLPPS